MSSGATDSSGSSMCSIAAADSSGPSRSASIRPSMPCQNYSSPDSGRKSSVGRSSQRICNRNISGSPSSSRGCSASGARYGRPPSLLAVPGCEAVSPVRSRSPAGRSPPARRRCSRSRRSHPQTRGPPSHGARPRCHADGARRRCGPLRVGIGGAPEARAGVRVWAGVREAKMRSHADLRFVPRAVRPDPRRGPLRRWS